MTFPQRPTCHDKSISPAFRFGETVWREAETSREDEYPFRPFRNCSYCGSIHPEDLMRALEGGAKLGGSDWKYGWPHKFYLEGIPHDREDQLVITSSTYSRNEAGETIRDNIKHTPMGKASSKWYNVHLLDEGYDAEALARLIDALEKYAGIRFEIEGTDLKYSAPYRGYQR